MTNLSISKLKQDTKIGFGTSGVRALVTELTDKVCYSYTKAFLTYLKKIGNIGDNGNVAIAGDLRQSTDRIMKAVAMAVEDCGLKVINCGKIPTPAVTYFGIQNGMPSIMVTGSHIPDDRNGIKFNRKDREILKSDEAGITESTIEINDSLFDENGAFVNDNYILPAEDESAKKLYMDRYLNFFGPNALEGKNIGLYGHSAVGRDIIFEILTNLGAKVSKLDYSDHFIPVDTEMVSEEMAAKGKEWNNNYHFDCLVTTDGDSDRPLLADEEGSWCRADTTGIMVGKYLGIKTIVAPISCNTALEKSKTFENISRTKIGSPYVVEEMMRVKDKGLVPVAGYEANGGFLLGTEVNKNGKILKALATRDAIIVHLAIIMLAKENGTTIKEMTSQLPKRFTQSLSLKGFPTELSLKIIEKLSGGTFEEQKEKIQRDTGNVFGQVKSVDLTDGLRITFENEDIVHFRPSQNSPEFRSYVESGSQERADKLAKQALDIIEGWMNKPTN